MVCHGSVTLALRGGARGLCNNIRTRQTFVMPLSTILLSSPLQLVFNNLLLVCGFLFFLY